ncbi:MAG: sigma 54-interacting transcriptional regulator [Verrucomicrobia bacterium]|nr:sigma 54-interacting transcriptional regulator [Verrucomicrobiota bacterium]
MNLALSEYVASCRSHSMRELLRVAERVAPSDVPVLLTGESGTGKEAMAHLIHNHSGRENFLRIDCAALDPRELEEAYGEARGATLLLRDICEMPCEAQQTLHWLLDEAERAGAGEDAGHPRIIAITDTNLDEPSGRARLGGNLYYRLATVPLHLPPLRQRREDIMPLANRFLSNLALEAGRPMSGFTQAASDRLTNFDWPGNEGLGMKPSFKTWCSVESSSAKLPSLMPQIFRSNCRPGSHGERKPQTWPSP